MKRAHTLLSLSLTHKHVSLSLFLSHDGMPLVGDPLIREQTDAAAAVAVAVARLNLI